MSEQGRETRDAKQMLLASGAAAVEVIVSLMQDSGLKPELRLKAAESILDRIGGKNGSLEVSGEGIGAVRFEGVLEEWSR
ncbi:MAG: hypothetical protein IKA46_05235 [Clostridia bacterium]|nr:hypothetical protein [Clostridia bacterium]